MRIVFAAALALASFVVSPAMAQEREIAVLRSVLAEGPLDAGLFSDEFLAAVPVPQLEPILAEIKATIGPVLEVTPKGGPEYLVETATHEMASQISLNGEGRIAGLFFSPPTARNLSIDDLLSQLSALAPRSAYLITRNGETLHAREADASLAVGSAFKLGVLAALLESIGTPAGWERTARLEPGDLSLPSGILQNWPVGSVLTLDTLASLMISISDNTATDVLLRVAGREAVEAQLGIAPVISTRELFVLKGQEALRARYLAGDLEARRTVLAEAAALPLPTDASAMTPYEKGLEWEVPLSRLCALIDRVRTAPAFAINPGVARRTDWARIAFKGGRETGVLNLTTLVEDKDGNRYCVAASWNDGKAIAETKATSAYAGVLSLAARGKL